MTEDRIDWIANCHCPSGVAFPHDVKQAIKAALREASAPTQGADGESLRPVALYQVYWGETASWTDTTPETFALVDPKYRRIVYATRDTAPSDAQAPGLDKFLFVPPTSEAEAGWNAAIVHITDHIQGAASAPREET